MTSYLLSLFRPMLLLGVTFLLWSLCAIVIVAAQATKQPADQRQAGVQPIDRLAVISDTQDSAVITTTEAVVSDDAEILREDVTTVNRAAFVAVDTTEDYKALGYTDSRKVVRDDDGNLYVAYRKKLNAQYRIFIAKSTDQGASWTVLNGNQPVDTIGDYTQRVPSLAVSRNTKDNDNFLHLAWYGNDRANPGNQRQVKYLRLTTNGKLADDDCCVASFVVDGYSGQSLWQEHPAIYVNGSNVYIVWEGRDATNTSSKIKFVRSTDFGRQWTQPLNIAPTFAGSFSRPTLVVTYVGDKRQLYVVAYASTNGISQIYWSRSLDNGNTWAPWQPVAASSTDQRHASLARDKAGKLHIVWRQITEDNSRTILRYRVYNPALKNGAGTWVDDAQTIASRVGQCLFFPSIAIGSNDRVWVVWTQSSSCASLPNDDPTEGQILYMSKPLTGNWGNPTILTSGTVQLYGSLRSAPTPNSEVMDVVWLDGNQCAITPPPLDQKRREEEADVAAGTSCVIRYTTLK